MTFKVNKIVINRGFYLLFMFGGMALGFGKWIVFSNLLKPSEFGIYSTVITTLIFLSYFGVFGLNELLIKEGALLSGKRKFIELFKIRDEILIIGIYNSIIISIIILFFFSIYDFKDLASNHRILFCGILIINILFNIFDAGLRASLMSLSFSLMIFIRASTLFIFGYYFSNRFGISGILIAEFLSGFLAILYALFFTSRKIIFSNLFLSIIKIKKYFNKGYIFFGLQALRYSSFTMDKWIVSWAIGSIGLGQYSFLMITFLAGLALAGVYNAVIIPKIISVFSENSSIDYLFKSTLKRSTFFFIVGLLFSPLYLISANFVIKKYFINYLFDDILICMAYVYLGTIFHICYQFFDSFFYSINKQSELTAITGLGLLIFLTLYFVVGFYFFDIVYFCLAFCFSKFILFLIINIRVYYISQIKIYN